MADRIINKSGVRGTPVRMVDNGDGTFAEQVAANLNTALSESNDSITGHIGGYSAVVDATITRAVAPAVFATGDQVGALLTFAAGRSNGASGIVTGAGLIYSVNPVATPTFELYLFDATITVGADNDVWAPSDADLALSIGVITLSAPKVGTTGTGGNLLYSSDPVSLPFVCAGGSTSIFGLLVTRTAFTPIANPETLKIRLRVERN